MINKIVLFICILSYTTVFSQTTDKDTTKVSLVSYWQKGDHFRFKIKKSDEEWRNNVSSKKNSSEYLVNFRVTDSTAKSYTIEWTYENNIGKNLSLPENYTNKLKKYNRLQIIYTTNELGQFQGIQNWKEISKYISDFFADLISISAEESPEKRDALVQIVAQSKNIFTTKEGIESFLTPEIRMFHLAYGIEYPTNKVIEYQEEIQNPFSNNPIKSNTKLFLDKIDFEDYSFTLVKESTVDEKESKNFMLSFIDKLNMSNKKEAEKAFKNSSMNINDTVRMSFYFDLGIPYLISSKKVVEMNMQGNKGKQIITTDIELVIPE
ncbi:MAG: hypothetical protein H6604_01250 [Flavobacteriales bacterium]|nr:hypothetical protein [Flavobacteriales bacterium]